MPKETKPQNKRIAQARKNMVLLVKPATQIRVDSEFRIGCLGLYPTGSYKTQRTEMAQPSLCCSSTAGLSLRWMFMLSTQGQNLSCVSGSQHCQAALRCPQGCHFSGWSSSSPVASSCEIRAPAAPFWWPPLNIFQCRNPMSLGQRGQSMGISQSCSLTLLAPACPHFAVSCTFDVLVLCPVLWDTGRNSKPYKFQDRPCGTLLVNYQSINIFSLFRLLLLVWQWKLFLLPLMLIARFQLCQSLVFLTPSLHA